MTVTYGQTIEWYGLGGESTSLTVGDCDTHEEARSTALAMAIKWGWTPPRWWEWWRRGEQPRFTPEEVARAGRKAGVMTDPGEDSRKASPC